MNGTIKINGDGFNLVATWYGGMEPKAPRWTVQADGPIGESAARVIREELEDGATGSITTIRGVEELPPRSWFAFVSRLASLPSRQVLGYELQGAKPPGRVEPNSGFEVLLNERGSP